MPIMKLFTETMTCLCKEGRMEKIRRNDEKLYRRLYRYQVILEMVKEKAERPDAPKPARRGLGTGGGCLL